MSRIALRGLAVGLAALLPALAARGSAKEGVELDRALQAIENGTDASRSGDASLTRLVAKLEQRYAARRLEFAEVARRPLPAKAAERLTQAQAAHEAGQGHLLELLRAIARPARDANQDARAARAREARALLAQLGVASRQEPLSAELKLRAPAWQPAALPRATGTHFEEPPAGPIGPIPAQLQLLADSLNGPIEIYAWVRNNLRPEFYYGSMKGPLQAFLDRSGNDADTAAVLVALLRAKGIPARYVQGLAEVDIGRLMAVTGTSSVEQSLRVLQRAGIPYEPLPGNSNIVSGVKLARVWAEAYVPYVNYRGLPLDAQGKLWVPLDAGFKNLVQPGGQRVVRDLGLVPQALVDEYLSQPRSQTPLEFARQQVTALLAPSGHTYEQALNNRGWASEELGILPNALPYVPSGPTDVTYDPPLAHHVRVVGEWNGTTLIDATLALPDILGQRLTLSYVPFDDDDARTVAQFGGLTHTPPYLVQVKPLLKVGGIVTAIGEAPIGAAVKFDLKVVLSSPGGDEELHNQVLAGNLMAIGLAGGEDTGVEQQSEHAAALLSRAAFQYLRNWNQSDAELANLFRVAPVRPTASACFVMSDIEVEYAGGDPLYPVTFEWKGVAIDADLRSSAPVGIDSRAEEKDFTLLSGLEGSILENRLFEDLWHVGSVSTAKALQIAAQQGVLVLTLTRDNVDVLLPGLPLDPQSKEEIRDAALRGFTVRVPAAPVTYLAWTGVGWWILDEETGESAWQLQGGHSGGVTAAASIDWPDQQLVETIVDQGEAAAPEATPVAQVRKFVSTDFQDGIVDKPLGRPFRVLALDAEGQRVPKAPVTFQVIGGGGSLLDPATGRAEAGTLTVLANDRGEAEATLVLGKRTDEIPRYVCLEAEPCSVENEVWGTLVGLNLVTVVSGTGVLSEPFTAYGAPDDQFDGTSRYAYLSANSWPSGDGVWNLSVAGLLAINVRDQHGNPLSNFRVRFAYKAPPELGTPPPGWQLARGATDTPGKLLRLRDYVACLVGTPSPRWGECAGESEELIVPSTIYGSVSYPVLGDSPYSAYKFDIGTEAEPSASTLSLGTWGYLCSPTCDTWWGRWPDTLIDVDSRPVLFGRRGDMIEAYAPSTSAEMKFSAQALYEGYEVEPFVDDQGTKHYRVKGNNRWTREPLDDSTFELNPATPGTGASPSPASSVGNGVYTSQMVMSGTPQLNTVNFTSKNTPLLIPHNLPDHNDEVDPAAVDESTLQITKRKYPDRPQVWTGTFSLWGVKPEVTGVVPSPILLTDLATVEQDAQVNYVIEPSAYAALLDPTEIRFDLKKGDATIVSASGGGGGPFTVPRGLSLPPGVYSGVITLLGVSYGADLVSAGTPVIVEPIRIMRTTTRWKPQRDPSNTKTIDVKMRCADGLTDVRLLVTAPPPPPGQTALPPSYVPTTEFLPLPNNLCTLVWKGPWTIKDSNNKDVPLPRGNYTLSVAANIADGAGTPIAFTSRPYDKVSLVEVVSIRFEPVADAPTLDANPAIVPLAGEPSSRARPGGGLRIFSEAKVLPPAVADDPVVYDRVNVLVETAPDISDAPADQKLEVRFRSLDVDDPAKGVSVIDNDSKATDNCTAVAPLDPPGCHAQPHGYLFDPATDPPGTNRVAGDAGLNVPSKTSTARATLVVSMRQGDNYRVAASTSKAWLDQLQALQQVTGGELKHNGGDSLLDTSGQFGHPLISEMLTVWRTLHLEVDRQAASNRQQAQTDLDTRGSFTALAARKLTDTSAPFYAQHSGQDGWEDGYLALAFHANPTTGWTGVDLSAPLPAADRYRISGNAQAVVDVQLAQNQPDLLRGLAVPAIAQHDYLVRDDEITSLDSFLTDADYVLSSQLLERAYIKLDLVREPSGREDLPFVIAPGNPLDDRRYMDGNKILAVRASVPTHPAWWSTHHVSAFDGDDEEDLDPPSEHKSGKPPSANLGLTFYTHLIDPRDGTTVGSKIGSYVFLETLRDLYAKPPSWFPTPLATEAVARQRDAAHELLHALDVPHPVNANDYIMCAIPMVKAAPKGGTMEDGDVARLRKIGAPAKSSSPPNGCQ